MLILVAVNSIFTVFHQEHFSVLLRKEHARSPSLSLFWPMEPGARKWKLEGVDLNSSTLLFTFLEIACRPPVSIYNAVSSWNCVHGLGTEILWPTLTFVDDRSDLHQASFPYLCDF